MKLVTCKGAISEEKLQEKDVKFGFDLDYPKSGIPDLALCFHSTIF